MMIDEQPGASGPRSSKQTLRRRLLAERRTMDSAEVASVSSRVVERLLSLSELADAATVLLYASDPDEIDLSILSDADPPRSRVLLPRVEGDRLVLARHTPGDALVIGAFGVREPSGPAVEPSDVSIDAVIVPGVAFSPAGGRLGRGRGFYDRLLPSLQGAVRIGVCAERFVVDDLPLDDHDAEMDLIVSEAAVRRRDTFVDDASA